MDICTYINEMNTYFQLPSRAYLSSAKKHYGYFNFHPNLFVIDVSHISLRRWINKLLGFWKTPKSRIFISMASTESQLIKRLAGAGSSTTNQPSNSLPRTNVRAGNEFQDNDAVVRINLSHNLGSLLSDALILIKRTKKLDVSHLLILTFSNALYDTIYYRILMISILEIWKSQSHHFFVMKVQNEKLSFCKNWPHFWIVSHQFYLIM